MADENIEKIDRIKNQMKSLDNLDVVASVRVDTRDASRNLNSLRETLDGLNDTEIDIEGTRRLAREFGDVADQADEAAQAIAEAGNELNGLERGTENVGKLGKAFSSLGGTLSKGFMSSVSVMTSLLGYARDNFDSVLNRAVDLRLAGLASGKMTDEFIKDSHDLTRGIERVGLSYAYMGNQMRQAAQSFTASGGQINDFTNKFGTGVAESTAKLSRNTTMSLDQISQIYGNMRNTFGTMSKSLVSDFESITSAAKDSGYNVEAFVQATLAASEGTAAYAGGLNRTGNYLRLLTKNALSYSDAIESFQAAKSADSDTNLTMLNRLISEGNAQPFFKLAAKSLEDKKDDVYADALKKLKNDNKISETTYKTLASEVEAHRKDPTKALSSRLLQAVKEEAGAKIASLDYDINLAQKGLTTGGKGLDVTEQTRLLEGMDVGMLSILRRGFVNTFKSAGVDRAGLQAMLKDFGFGRAEIDAAYYSNDSMEDFYKKLEKIGEVNDKSPQTSKGIDKFNSLMSAVNLGLGDLMSSTISKAFGFSNTGDGFKEFNTSIGKVSEKLSNLVQAGDIKGFYSLVKEKLSSVMDKLPLEKIQSGFKSIMEETFGEDNVKSAGIILSEISSAVGGLFSFIKEHPGLASGALLTLTAAQVLAPISSLLSPILMGAIMNPMAALITSSLVSLPLIASGIGELYDWFLSESQESKNVQEARRSSREQFNKYEEKIKEYNLGPEALNKLEEVKRLERKYYTAQLRGHKDPKTWSKLRKGMYDVKSMIQNSEQYKKENSILKSPLKSSLPTVKKSTIINKDPLTTSKVDYKAILKTIPHNSVSGDKTSSDFITFLKSTGLQLVVHGLPAREGDPVSATLKAVNKRVNV